MALASGSGPYVDVIRKAQLELELELANLRCVDANGLHLEPDGLHLSTGAQVRLGHMMADAFLGITAPLPVQSSGANKRRLPWDGLGSSFFENNYVYIIEQWKNNVPRIR